MEESSKPTLSNATYYRCVDLGDGVRLGLGDFAKTVKSKKIGRVSRLYERSGQKYAHMQGFVLGRDTVLGEETADSHEVFETYTCSDVWLGPQSLAKAVVSHWPVPDDWAWIGGTEASVTRDKPPIDRKLDQYFYRLRYCDETVRFETATGFGDDDGCASCSAKSRLNLDGKIVPVDCLTPNAHPLSQKKWGGFVYEGGVRHMVGDAVFLTPKAAAGGQTAAPIGGCHPKVFDKIDEKALEYSDEAKYPEAYRKTDYVKGCNETTPQPFDVGIVVDVFTPMGSFSAQNLRLKIRSLYRPYQVAALTGPESFSKDFNLLYWSNDIRTVEATTVRGKCHVLPKQSIETGSQTIQDWTARGVHRFYYESQYDKAKDSVCQDLCEEAKTYSAAAKGQKNTSDDGSLPQVSQPLRALDVFAGCGGLSSGLKAVGVSEANWAIEVYEPAAEAYKLNEPDCSVFTDDCNLLLQKVMEDQSEEGAEHQGQRLPKKGQVELLCGGPPCQGFSGMNRFNSGEYSQFKNSLISTYLSYCDYYRPRFFILENVRNFASFKNNMVLKLCLRALTKMGYQTSFAILQAGHYGVAQTRRRCIIMAAAPGEKLPLFPEPQHVFAKVSLSVTINDKKYVSNCRWAESGHAPYRTVTVKDTMSDLPEITNRGGNQVVMDYHKPPESHFQREMRAKTSECKSNQGKSGLLRDHICKEMCPLVEARMSLIPRTPGSDWRDLPNIQVEMSNGHMTDILEYNYDDVEKGRGKSGAKRGVCQCAEFKNKKLGKCSQDKQTDTLIPWCLPHTSNRHNNWAGLYGRIAWDGFFSTTVTNPEPMGKQGRVLHPEQHRLVSVRECARSQGFPDHYNFYGNTVHKHRQVGNAVAPPMGKALGLEIRKCL